MALKRKRRRDLNLNLKTPAKRWQPWWQPDHEGKKAALWTGSGGVSFHPVQQRVHTAWQTLTRWPLLFSLSWPTLWSFSPYFSSSWNNPMFYLTWLFFPSVRSTSIIFKWTRNFKKKNSIKTCFSWALYKEENSLYVYLIPMLLFFLLYHTENAKERL